MAQLDKNKAAKPADQPVSRGDFLALAGFLQGNEKSQRGFKRDPNSDAVRTAADLFGNREYLPAYECFKPVYDKVVGDMQRVLARNLDFEANKLAHKERVPIAAAKERAQNIRVHAQQVLDQFNRLMNELQNKPLVRAHIRKGAKASVAVVQPVEEAAPTILSSAEETVVAPAVPTIINPDPPADDALVASSQYTRATYAPPEVGFLYAVRDKAKGERVVRVVSIDPDSAQIQVEVVEEGKTRKPIQLAIDSLARQAAKGWCTLLLPVAGQGGAPRAVDKSADLHFRHVSMRLDTQNFSRCCSDIVRANIKFSIQAIKDVQDGPFRAGNYEQAFLIFEQIAVQFNSAVANSRRDISEGRRLLSTQKFKLSGKEVVERMAAFQRSESLIQVAEREFSTILEGLRMFLRVQAAAENPNNA